MARQKGLPEPKGPEPPEEFAFLWFWWRDLAAGRGVGGFGIASLTWLDIDAWSRISEIRVRPTEARVLLLIDAAWRREMHQLQEAMKPSPKGK